MIRALPLLLVLVAVPARADCRTEDADVVCPKPDFAMLTAFRHAETQRADKFHAALVECERWRQVDAEEARKKSDAQRQRILTLEALPAPRPAIPWRAIGIATGVGLVAGVVIGIVVAT